MAFFVFIAGILIGSFLNVCIYRLPSDGSLLFSPSRCPSCDSKLRWFDLIPIFSYLIQRGKCRYCGGAISLRYPLVEMLNSFLWVFLYLKWGLIPVFSKYIILTSLLLVITLIDFYHKIIPDELTLFGLLTGLIFLFIPDSGVSVTEGLMGLFSGGGLFLFIAILSRGGMGGGDIKLTGVLGLVLGWRQILLVSLLSFIIGAILSLFLLLFKLKGRKDPIPFGPFIAFSAYIVMLYGHELISSYLNYILIP